MHKQNTEPELRREAVRRKAQGQRTCDISRALQHTPQWVNKWWREYRHNPQTNFADHSRTPHTHPQQTCPTVVQVIVTTRQLLEQAQTPQTRYGLIGHRAVQSQLVALGVEPIPSLPTIQRILNKNGLTHALGAGAETAYYPWPLAWEVNAIHATDIITRHLTGGQAIEHFHTIDHYSRAVCLTQHLENTSAITCQHLLKSWAKLGLPLMQQFDNESNFCGGHTHPRVIGRVVRLCLLAGVEVIFIPVYEAKRNYQIESFHSLWVAGFWTRRRFSDVCHVQTELPLFLHWYHHLYRPPHLHGQTPSQARSGAAITRFTTELQTGLPDWKTGKLPVTAGRFHIMRKVDNTGQVEFLNETWSIGKKWSGEYIRATINTARQTLTFWHQLTEDADWRLLKSRTFLLKESVHDLLPQFKRNQKRCRDYWPG